MSKNKVYKLAFELLEHKYLYYMCEKPIISDYEFDMLQKEYEELCYKHNIAPTAVDMVDFDIKRPSCFIAACKVHGVNPLKGDYVYNGKYKSICERVKNGSRGYSHKPLPIVKKVDNNE